MSRSELLRESLCKHFGFSEFREGQAEVIQAVLDGKDAVVVMPTGGGKSLCYQLPSILIKGITIVVSPLIALMKDQVDALNARGIAATFINSSLNYKDYTERLDAVRQGNVKIIYVAPERFRNEGFVQAISQAEVKLLAVDEAHCISHWGHDFRPDYLRLAEAAEMLKRPQIIALTATATSMVRNDIIRQLCLKSPRVFVAGFDRPNLSLVVHHASGEADKLDTLEHILTRATGSGIIYVATRKAVERVSAHLKMTGFDAEP